MPEAPEIHAAQKPDRLARRRRRGRGARCLRLSRRTPSHPSADRARGRPTRSATASALRRFPSLGGAEPSGPDSIPQLSLPIDHQLYVRSLTGIITLAPGSYHFTGVSVVAYMSGGEPAEMTTVRAPASAGYCRLRTVGPSRVLNPGMRDVDNADPSVICIGSPSTANLTASLFQAYMETDKTVEIVLEHQSGSNPEQIYLRVFTQNSPWHAMARISIRNV